MSWFEPEPRMSLELLDLLGVGPLQSVVDVGGGASVLVDRLLARGHTDLGVVDLSSVALAEARARVGDPGGVEWVSVDVLTWDPGRSWDVWHDRAVLHFLVEDGDRAAYSSLLRTTVGPGGRFVIGGFAEDGPVECSGLPVRRSSLDELVALVGPSEVAERRRDVHVTPWGSEQVFNWIAGRVAPG